MFSTNILSWVIFQPLAGAIVIAFLRNENRVRQAALGFTLLDFVLSVPLWIRFDLSTHEMQFVERASWIPAFNINYAIGLDGISLLLVLLTTLISPICVLCSWKAIETRVKEFMIVILVMETAMLGVFCALDFFLFYIFWEAMLIPMYLIIGVWGGPRRIYAAVKFFLYTLAGSLLLLVAILVLYFAGGRTFDIQSLMGQAYSPVVQFWIFWAFFLAFAIKVPMFPFHTWLPDAHVEAPTAGSVLLASVLLKMGAYGFLRFCLPLVPDASLTFTPFILALSLVAIIYGAFMALAQTDLKKLIAYSSVGHMGFVTLGIFVLNAQGIEGSLLQMVNHGITTGALFLCVGMIYDRSHSRLISDCSGVGKSMPVYVTFLVIFSFSSFGLPGTNGFIGELLILVGAFFHNPLVASIAIPGVLLSATYMLWMLQRMIWGKSTGKDRQPFHDLSLRELATVIPLVILVFWIGLNPGPFLNVMHASVEHLVGQMNGAQAIEITGAFIGR